MVMAFLFLRKRESSKMHGWIVCKNSKMMKQLIICERRSSKSKEGRMFMMIRNIRSNQIPKKRMSNNRERKINKIKNKRRIHLVASK